MSAPSTRCLGCSRGFSSRGGGCGFPHAQREELLRLSTESVSQLGCLEMDKNLLRPVLKYRCILTHTHCLGSQAGNAIRLPPLCPLFRYPSPYSFSQEILLTLCPVSAQLEEPIGLHVGCWSFSFALWFCTHTAPLSTPSSGSSPVSPLDSSLSHQGLSSMSGTCKSILNWPSPSASRLEENCPCSQTFSTHQGGHLRGIFFTV